jgi:hypothetical protein
LGENINRSAVKNNTGTPLDPSKEVSQEVNADILTSCRGEYLDLTGEETGEMIKLHSEGHNLYSSPDITRAVKSRRMRWTGHVTHMTEMRNAYKILVGKSDERPRRGWEDSIEMVLKDFGRVWPGSI